MIGFFIGKVFFEKKRRGIRRLFDACLCVEREEGGVSDCFLD